MAIKIRNYKPGKKNRAIRFSGKGNKTPNYLSEIGAALGVGTATSVIEIMARVLAHRLNITYAPEPVSYSTAKNYNNYSLTYLSTDVLNAVAQHYRFGTKVQVIDHFAHEWKRVGLYPWFCMTDSPDMAKPVEYSDLTACIHEAAAELEQGNLYETLRILKEMEARLQQPAAV